MKQITLETFRELDNAAWFSNVGKQDTETAIVLSDWRKAIDACRTIRWQNMLLEMANCYRERVRQASIAPFREWNHVVSYLKPIVLSFVSDKIGNTSSVNQLDPIFEQTVQWDILHLCIESEYQDICGNGFYASQGYWYVRGHFPCGWDGEFPDGRYVVY